MKVYRSKAEIYADLQDQFESLKCICDLLAEVAQSIHNTTDVCSDCIRAGIMLGADIDFNVDDMRVIFTMGNDTYNASEAITQFVETFSNDIAESQEAINQINNQ